MDFKQLKTGIKEISEIASSAPEPFRNKCFEVLLTSLLAEQAGVGKKDEKKKDDDDGGGKDDSTKPPAGSSVPMNSQLHLLLKKTGLTEEELNKVVMVENGEVHFVQEPHPGKIREGQLEWSLLMSLKNTILKNAMEADPEEIRSNSRATSNLRSLRPHSRKRLSVRASLWR
jgi:hypothetical protein